MLDLNSSVHWHDAWRALGARAGEQVLPDLLARYAEPHRFYHTAEHLAECFSFFDAVRDRFERPAEVLLALWFHDAVYDTRRSDNEDVSAGLAERCLGRAGVAEDSVRRIAALIRATRHGAAEMAVASTSDTALMLDLDLAILGAEPERFDAYDRAVRLEYAWVGDAEYREGRARVLRRFLERKRVYETDYFNRRYEARARANLTGALKRLAAL